MRKKGFTLIELMITIAIVGILLSLAVPAYQNYTIRAKVAEALTVASSFKSLIAESYLNTGNIPADAAAAGISSDFATEYIQEVGYKKEGDVGQLQITLSDKVSGSDLEGRILLLEAKAENNILKWTCTTSAENDKDIGGEYLPANCRKGESTQGLDENQGGVEDGNE